jgi:cell division protein FtsI/penicillin-binding protein 2
VDSTLPVVGKSGTGELPAGKDYVNWFVGWAEGQEEQPLVVVTMIDGGGTFQEGSEMTAGPAVRHILEAYYGVEQSPNDPHATDTHPGAPADRASTESESDAAPVE